MNNEPEKQTQSNPIKPNLARHSVWRVYPPQADSNVTLSKWGITRIPLAYPDRLCYTSFYITL
jgi:hypothetical protein